MQIPNYTSVDHILEEVRAMRVRGGSAFGQAAALAFRFVALDDRIETPEALFAELDRVAAQLLAEKPTMATIHNARTLIVDTTRRDEGADLPRLREAIVARADRFVRMSRGAVDALGRVGARLVQDGQTVMMHSFSESVLSIFEKACAEGKRFTVCCTESRPLREGRVSARRLSALGVPVIFATDASMAELARRADWIVVGADSIGIDGSVANKMGTNLLSIVAERFDRPFYVATELLKLQPLTEQGYPIQLEQRPPGEVAAPGDFDDDARVEVRNQFFDLTPPYRIRALLTERGLISPAQVAQAWRDLQTAF